MDNPKVKRVVIAGGGTSGWLAAAALSKKLGEIIEITLIESEAIGTIGVGEATIPPMRTFHKLLGIDEQEFMRATAATFKLGIKFENWGALDDSYIHSFGQTGKETWLAGFHNFWLHGQARDLALPFSEYCLELQAAKAGKFATSPQSSINYAYHLDAGNYATYLRSFCRDLGLNHIEGKIVNVAQNPDNGFITALTLDSGEVIEGDLFIDCTGFRGVLIEQTLHTGYEDWSHWLPCDSAVAVQTQSVAPAAPYTRSIAHESGWQWRIPLQHRVGNGLVYCSKYMTDEDARALLLDNIQGETINEPRVIKYRTGRRRMGWNKNCIALGLSSGFVEPLESTSIHLLMMGVTRLMQLFPFSGIHESVAEEYNEQARVELEKIRDFIVLHYYATARDDSPFWRHCKSMSIPDSLRHRIDLFRETGRVFQSEGELFRVDSWTQVMMGQGIMPKEYHPMATMMSDQELKGLLDNISSGIQDAVARMPTHEQFIEQYCKLERSEALGI